MVDYREILRLSSEGNSQRQIAASVGSSHHTVSEVLTTAKLKGIEWSNDDSITNEMLQSILFPDKYAAISVYLEPDYEYIHRELAKPHVTMTLLWEEYSEKCIAAGKKPYMTTQFGDKYRRWARVTKATMRIHHKPGDSMEVDWAGQTLPYYDSVTGEATQTYLFVAVLPCSCYAYAELCRDMKQESWLLCHAHAYSYFGGVTRLLIPDNLKTGVVSNTRYETVLNRSYRELSEYYNTAIVPCRVESPKDKSHAEATVNYAETWILASLRNEHFFSFEEAHEAVKEKLEELNNKPFKTSARQGCRRTSYVIRKCGVCFGFPFGFLELFSHVTRKVFVSHKVRSCADLFAVLGVAEDNALEVGEQFLLALARQFAHILHIHHSSLTHRECKSFACRVHSVNPACHCGDKQEIYRSEPPGRTGVFQNRITETVSVFPGFLWSRVFFCKFFEKSAKTCT